MRMKLGGPFSDAHKEKGRRSEDRRPLATKTCPSQLFLHFKLCLNGPTLRHIDFSFHLTGKRMPGKDLMLAGWNVLQLERPIVLGDRIVRIPHREIKSLHEFMLVALQAVRHTGL